MEEALRQLLDRQLITDLLHDYCFYIDTKQPEKLRDLFTADCRVTYTRRLGSFAGIDALIAALVRVVGETFRTTSHQISNIRLHFEDADHAVGVTYLHAYHVFQAPRPAWLLWGRYHDRFVRTPDGWRMAERELHVSGETNLHEPPAST